VTEEQFRQSPFRQQLAEFLDTPCGEHLLQILAASLTPRRIDANAAASAWIAEHERNVGRDETIQLTISLSTPIENAPSELVSNFGVPPDQMPSPEEL
jgi:hypothetical protein